LSRALIDVLGLADAEAGALIPEGLQKFVGEFVRSRGPLRVLEAGCGSSSQLDLGEQADVAGIDLSEQQLRRNTTLSRRIVGDIQTYRWLRGEFDIVVCWNVLEHLPDPIAALDHLAEAVDRDGLLILALPNVLSAKGLVTKFTPHRFHVWVYRRIFGIEWAGKDENGPFPTYLRVAISPEALKRYGRSHGFAVEYFCAFENFGQMQLRRRLGIHGGLWALLKRLCNVLTLGKITLEETDYVLVLRNTGTAA
jgi:SAM-dependent methyltransferase